MQPSNPATHRIGHRNLFPAVLHQCGLYGEGVEVGVQAGVYSEVLLRSWGGKRLYSIDPWREWPGDRYLDEANVSQAEQESIYQQARERLAQFQSRSVIIRKTSAEAVADFADDSLDFVYLDGQHHYDAIVDDIRLWFPKIKAGGFLCGHDYRDFNILKVCGVRTAVNEFFNRHKFRDFIVSIEDSSWFIRITEDAS